MLEKNQQLAALKAASAVVQPDIALWSDVDLVATIRNLGISTKLKIDESQIHLGKVYVMSLNSLLMEENRRVRKSSQLTGVSHVFANNKTIVVEPGLVAVAKEQGKLTPVAQFVPGIPCNNQAEGMSISIATAMMTTVYGLEAKGRRNLSIPDNSQKFYSNQPVVHTSDKEPQEAFNFAYKALTEGANTIDQRDRLAKAIYNRGTMTYGGYLLTRYQPLQGKPETNVKKPMTEENKTRLIAKGYKEDLIPTVQFKFASMPAVNITNATMDRLISLIDAHRSVRGADKGKISQLCSMMYMGELPASLNHSIVDAVCYRAVHDRILKLFPKFVGLSLHSSVNTTTLDILRNHLILHNPISPHVLTFSAAFTKTPQYIAKNQIKKKDPPTKTITVSTTLITSPSPSPSPSPGPGLSVIKPDLGIPVPEFDKSIGETFNIPMSPDLVGIKAYNHLLASEKKNVDYQVPATHLLRIVKYPMPAPTFSQGKYTPPTTLLFDLTTFRSIVMNGEDNVIYEVFAYSQMFEMSEITVFEHPIPHRNMVFVYKPKFKSNYTFAAHFKRVASANVWRTYYPLHRKVYWKYDDVYHYRALLVSRGFLRHENNELGYVLSEGEKATEYDGIDDFRFEEFVKDNPVVPDGTPQIRSNYGLSGGGDVLVGNNNNNNNNALPLTPQNVELQQLARAANNSSIDAENADNDNFTVDEGGFVEEELSDDN